MGADGLPARRPDLKADGRGCAIGFIQDAAFWVSGFFFPSIQAGYLRPGGPSLVCAVKLSRLNEEVATIPRRRQGKRC